MLILSHSADGCAVVQARGSSADRPGGLSHHDIANSRNPSGARAGPGGPAQGRGAAPPPTKATRGTRPHKLTRKTKHTAPGAGWPPHPLKRPWGSPPNKLLPGNPPPFSRGVKAFLLVKIHGECTSV